MDEYVYGLRDYLRVFRERWRTIGVVTALVLVAALLFTYARGDETPIEAPVTSPVPAGEEGAVYVLLAATTPPEGSVTIDPELEKLRILSAETLRVAGEKTGTTMDELIAAVAVAPVGTHVLLVSADEVNEASGSEIASAVAETYLDSRSTEIRRTYRQAIAVVEEQIATLSSDGSEGSQIANAVRVASLQAELARLAIERKIADVGQIVDAPAYARQASPTSSPAPQAAQPETTAEPSTGDSPYLRNAIAGIVLGLILGAGVALAQDVLDPRFRTPEEIERLLALPVMTFLPTDATERRVELENLRAQLPRDLTSLTVVTSGDREAVRELANRLDADERHQVAVVSRSEDEGYLASASDADATLLAIDRDNDKRADILRELGALQRAGGQVIGVVVF